MKKNRVNIQVTITIEITILIIIALLVSHTPQTHNSGHSNDSGNQHTNIKKSPKRR